MQAFVSLLGSLSRGPAQAGRRVGKGGPCAGPTAGAQQVLRGPSEDDMGLGKAPRTKRKRKGLACFPMEWPSWHVFLLLMSPLEFLLFRHRMFHSSTCALASAPSTVTVQPQENRAPCGSRDGRWVSWMKGFLWALSPWGAFVLIARRGVFPALPGVFAQRGREAERGRNVQEGQGRTSVCHGASTPSVPSHARGQV